MKPATRLTAAWQADNRARRRYRAYLAAALIAVATPASAQIVCGPTLTIRDHLGQRYGEETASRGLTADGSSLEMLANRDTGTWTLIVTTPDGVSCVVAVGQDFDVFAARPNL